MLRGLLIGVMLLLGGVGLLLISPPGQDYITERLTLRDGADSYLYGYPLVTMATAHEALTAPPLAGNTFVHLSGPITAESPPGAVRPSLDFLYSSAWLDVPRGGAFLVATPDMGQRYWAMPVLDAWTDVLATPGTRTTGSGPGRFLITGPDYRGPVPRGAEVVEADTGLVWLLARIAVAGPDDVPATQALQDGLELFPVTADGMVAQQPTEPVRLTTAEPWAAAVRSTVDAMTSAEFFDRLAAALAANPPRPADSDAVATLDRLGVRPGEPFDGGELTEGQLADLAQLPARMQQGMSDAASSEGSRAIISNGWRISPPGAGAFGIDYAGRAVLAREGLGATLPADTVYATAASDADGTALDAARGYAITVPAHVPAQAFWSVTVYDEQGFLPGGASGGLSVSSLADLPVQPDGSVRIVVSRQDPGGGVAWLQPPAEGRFSLTMRLHWPDDDVLAGDWEFPSLTPLD